MKQLKAFSFFVALGPNGGIEGIGQTLGQTPDQRHCVLEFRGSPRYRRVLPWSGLSNFAFFETEAELQLFLTPVEQRAANGSQLPTATPPSRPETPAAADPGITPSSREGGAAATAAPPAEANNVVPLKAGGVREGLSDLFDAQRKT